MTRNTHAVQQDEGLTVYDGDKASEAFIWSDTVMEVRQ
jgi:hypothetical protein